MMLAVAAVALLSSVRVVSVSMMPTLEPGDRVVVDTLSTRAPSIGDLVVLREPDSGTLVVKRVVGVAGDTIALEDGRLRRNGVLIDEPYVDLGGVDSVYFGPERVPAGTLFVMGDNRGASIDSRSYGPIDDGRVVGRVLLRWWPPRS